MHIKFSQKSGHNNNMVVSPGVCKVEFHCTCMYPIHLIFKSVYQFAYIFYSRKIVIYDCHHLLFFFSFIISFLQQ